MPLNRLIKLVLLLISTLHGFSQPVEKKYPSLLWEITGNGLKKPSYLFGTMHVSSKLAFHLPDSFYHAIRSVEAVALELNPDIWQGEMVRLDQLQMNYRHFSQPPSNDYLNEKSFQLEEYDDELKTALNSEPTVVNSLLYRTYKSKEDFEEDTFLDLYIFQTGKKLGKRATGVENYYETEKIILEAYRDMAREKQKKNVDTDGESMYDIAQKTQDAYRRGDLDMLDSLDNMMERSHAFRDKFLYKRNEIQAHSIDTIIRKYSLFVGVGAAHLAGPRGVIELLRQKGYTLRPVHMADRDAVQKDQIDKMKVPVKFISNSNEDGFYKVDAPGPLYKMATDISGLDRRQYADMSNGTYYLVTRVKTHAAFTGSSESAVIKRMDSLLYENIPGKIISKTPIQKSGYRGFDIVNKTRRGDIQRYHLYVTPFEVMIFKMSGKESYVHGPEAERFFSSIRLRPVSDQPVTFEPRQGGFRVKLPHVPDEFMNTSSMDAMDRWEYLAKDQAGNAFLIMRKSVNNFRFLEEDSFDLVLMEESFAGSAMLEKKISRHLSVFRGRPSMEVSHTDKAGSTVRARFIINGPHYYLLAVRSKNAKGAATNFFDSFEFTPYRYNTTQTFVDTFLKYSVNTPVVPELEENLRTIIEKITEDNQGGFGAMADPYWPKTKNALFRSDSTGEMIGVSMQQFPKYYFVKDSATFWKDEIADYMSRNDMMIISRDSFRTGDLNGYTFTLADTNSSRRIQRLWILRKDRIYRLVTITDSMEQQSSFIRNFWDTFKPQENNSEHNIYTTNTSQFFNDLFSNDSLVRSKAQASISNIYYRKNDIPKIIAVLRSLRYGDKNYFDSKSRFIAELGYIRDSTVSGDILNALKEIYYATADTSSFQNQVLHALAKIKTRQSYTLLKELLLQDPPVFESEFEYNTFFTDLEDSLPLTKLLFPEILQLSTIEDYKENINELLVRLVERKLVKSKDYDAYFTGMYFDARIELKKLQAKDEKRMENESNRNDRDQRSLNTDNIKKTNLDELSVLLMPFYDLRPTVKKYFDQLLLSRDYSVLLHTAVLLLKNKKEVPSKLLQTLAESDRYRIKLFRELEAAKIPERFPVRYNNQLDMAKSILLSEKNYETIDSIVFLWKQPLVFRGKNGTVYFFKYRIKKDDEWKIGISGIQPQAPEKASSDNTFAKLTDKRLKSDEPLDEQLSGQLQRLIFTLKKSSKNFYIDNGGRFKKQMMED